MSEKMTLRFKLLGCYRRPWCSVEVDPEKVRITVTRPASECAGATDRYGITTYLPERERIYISYADGDLTVETEVEDFSTPSMDGKTYKELVHQDGLSRCCHV
jgi:hypothetical protein